MKKKNFNPLSSTLPLSKSLKQIKELLFLPPSSIHIPENK